MTHMKRTLFSLIIVTFILAFASCQKTEIDYENPVIKMQINEIISQSILDYNKNSYFNGECVGEGHIIIGYDQKGNLLNVYTLTCYNEYEFQDGDLTQCSGSFSPAVIVLDCKNNEFKLKSISYPQDGSEYMYSIHDMFPKKYVDRVTEENQQDKTELERQSMEYAKRYLTKINRKAKVVSISDKFSNEKYSEELENLPNNFQEVMKQNELIPECPDWIGTREKIENGIRYIYKTDANKTTHKITFSKIDFKTNKTLKKTVVDSFTGSITDNY